MKKVIGIGVMLQTPTGTYLLQERDSNATLHPGRVAPFGGGIEKDEDTLSCARREMFEELRLNLDASNLSTIQLFESRHEPEVFIHMYLAKGIDKSSLVLQEGRAIVEMSKKEAMEHENVTDFTKEVLNVL